MSRKKNPSSVVIVLLALAMYLSIRLFILEPRSLNKLSENYTVVEGRFESFGRFDVGINTSTRYLFTYDGKEYNLRIMYKIPCKNFDVNNEEERRELKSMKFPVAVYNEDPTVAVPLLRPKDFNLIETVMPDSLYKFYDKHLDCTFFERFHY